MFNIIFDTNYSAQDKFISIVSFLCAMLIAFCMHEYAHGKVAYWNGDMTAKNMGRLTINPLKHLDPLGTILLLTVGFGWAKPVPINPNNFKKVKKGIFTVSIAGVTMNLILAIINFAFLLIIGAIVKATGGIIANGAVYVIFKLFVNFFVYGITINLTLMAFNLLPIYPLDGFHIVETFTKYDNKYCVFMRRYGSFILFGLLFIGNICSQIGGIFRYFDIIGLYINAIAGGIQQLMFLIFNLII